MRRVCYFLCFFPFLYCGPLATLENSGEEEALFLNRIADFWEEGEYKIAKTQIEEFLKTYPNSPFSDSLHSAIGDLFVREKNYSLALDSYAKVTDPNVAKRIFPHKMQCLYSLNQYAMLADECETFLQNETLDSEQKEHITYYLAASLYHECLHKDQDPDALVQLAKRAEPYFETLFQTPLKQDLFSAFAHILCILKEFPRAAAIYLDFAEDEMVFQAALIQAEYDKELALQTFKTIQEPSLQKEAAYNCLILLFDLKKYEEILQNQERFLEILSPEQSGLAHLLLSRSFLALGKYKEALSSFAAYLSTSPEKSDALEAALISYIEAAAQVEDLDALCQAIEKMESLYPDHADLLEGKFLKAQLLLKHNRPLEAKEELERLFAKKQDPKILLELIHIDAKREDWICSRNLALLFFSLFENDQNLSLVKEYLVHASSEIAQHSQEGKHQFIQDLQNLLEKEANPLWEWDLAKTFILLQKYEEALAILLNLPESLDADFLIALCYRDGFQDLPNFIHFGEKALSREDSSDQGSLHIALYNAYLAMELLDQAENHLFSAFQMNEKIEEENKIWLANRLGNQNKLEEAISLLESIPQNKKSDQTLFLLSQFYASKEEGKDNAICLLQDLLSLYETSPYKNEATLLLAELYKNSGKKEEARELFDCMFQEKSALRTYAGASACLQSAKIQIEKWENETPSPEDLSFQQTLSQLKDLVLQKNIVHEPIYLEAALDYIDLQSKSPEGNLKKRSLLEKMKRDFENTEDLLSKDYHIARSQLQKQDLIYQSYMEFLDAEILIQQNEQKELQAKAKDILLKIVEEKAHPALVARASQCLDQ